MNPILRPYQREGVASVFAAWETHASTLLSAPTGCGKTVTFSEVIRRMPGRAIVLTHTRELLGQAIRKLSDAGVDADIESAEYWANEQSINRAKVVCATTQTLFSKSRGHSRMMRLDPTDFNVLVIDEVHHYTAKAFRGVVDYFRNGNTNLKILGVTATPNRHDKDSLGQILESIAHTYEIQTAISDGYLVPIEQQMVHVEGLDYSKIRTTCGDLNSGELSRLMESEKPLHGIASASLDIIGQRRTLVFTVSISQGERLTEIFNRHRAGMASFVCGKTPKDKRHQILKDFANGETQVLVNVGCLVEGYDCPNVEVIVQARPTKSLNLYTQIVGRGLRPLPGIVDEYSTAEGRRRAIAESGKPSALILDFVGNSGRHKLISTIDLLGGHVSPEARERVLRATKKKGTPVSMVEALECAESDVRRIAEEKKAQDERRRAMLVAKARFSTREINPFDVLHLTPARAYGRNDKQLSERQRGFLLKQGINPDGLSFAQGKQLIDTLFYRMKHRLCTTKQANILERYGYENAQVYTKVEASELITRIANNGWQRPQAA